MKIFQNKKEKTKFNEWPYKPHKYRKVHQSIYFYIDYNIRIIFKKEKFLIFIIFDIKADKLLEFVFK